MSWQSIDFDGEILHSGERPQAHLREAVERIQQDYQQQFQRNPSIAEILYAFDLVMAEQSENVRDPENIASIVLSVDRD